MTSPALDDPRSANSPLSPRKIKLGEELPIFCEKCGYALHGLPQTRCDRCNLLQFHCPECGHHQPINTLRPAAQKALGRIRAVWLVWSVFFRINFFGWLLIAWAAMGVEFSYQFMPRSGLRTVVTGPGGTSVTRNNLRQFSEIENASLDWESMLAFSVFGLAFGLFGRMLLLRWRRGWIVGSVLAALACTAIAVGAIIQRSDRTRYYPDIPSPFTSDFVTMMAGAAASIVVGASVIWGIWLALVYVFLPKRAGQALLDWQTNQSARAADLARH